MLLPTLEQPKDVATDAFFGFYEVKFAGVTISALADCDRYITAAANSEL